VGSAFIQQYQLRQQAMLRPTELFDVVSKQISAIREDNYAEAYRQISNGFQEKFDIAAFSDLARSDYPLLGRAERVEFGAVQWDGERAVVPAYFFLPEGEVVPCLFHLVREESVWKIDSVRVQKRWPAGRRLGGMRA
jgi:hypothetical protein